MSTDSRHPLGALCVILAALLACKNEEPAPAAPASAAPTPVAAPAPTPTPEAAASEAAREPEKEDDPIPDIPDGRSKPPTVAEWSAAEKVNTQEANSQPDKCFMKIVREWLKVNCGGEIVSVDDPVDFGKENVNYFSSVRPGKSADFVVRLRQGKTMKLKIHRAKDKAVLFVNWPQSADKPTIVALGRG